VVSAEQAVLVPTPEQVKATRLAANLTQKQCAEIFGYGLRGWQKKEEAGGSARSLTIGEFYYLQLLANGHSEYKLVKK
jgi:transcriptional regulator with XRE-family HTH domain